MNCQKLLFSFPSSVTAFLKIFNSFTENGFLYRIRFKNCFFNLKHFYFLCTRNIDHQRYKKKIVYYFNVKFIIYIYI